MAFMPKLVHLEQGHTTTEGASSVNHIPNFRIVRLLYLRYMVICVSQKVCLTLVNVIRPSPSGCLVNINFAKFIDLNGPFTSIPVALNGYS